VCNCERVPPNIRVKAPEETSLGIVRWCCLASGLLTSDVYAILNGRKTEELARWHRSGTSLPNSHKHGVMSVESWGED
jgi:hypothetical protein